MCEIKIQKNKIISVLLEHTGERITIGLVMNMLVEMENNDKIVDDVELK